MRAYPLQGALPAPPVEQPDEARLALRRAVQATLAGLAEMDRLFGQSRAADLTPAVRLRAATHADQPLWSHLLRYAGPFAPLGRDRWNFGQTLPIHGVHGGAERRVPDMCNLYAVTKGQQAIREFTRAVHDTTGNLPPMPAVFPDYAAPVVRNRAEGERELALMPGQSHMSRSSAGSFSFGSIARVSEAKTRSEQTAREKHILLSSPYAIALQSEAMRLADHRVPAHALAQFRRDLAGTQALGPELCEQVNPLFGPGEACTCHCRLHSRIPQHRGQACSARVMDGRC